MGIPLVKWEKDRITTDLVQKEACGWPMRESKVEHGQKWSTAGRKLISRSEIPSPSTISGNEYRGLLLDTTQGLIWNGLILLSRFGTFLWTALPHAKHGGVKSEKNERSHARAWKET